MNLPLISVVIPVYNAEKYLKQCLESISQQTYSNLEIICVNDGSTDGSLNILQKFQQKDSRFILINQKNRGLSAARNKGLEYVSADYVSFVDADDYVDPRYIEVLYNQLYEENSDFCLCGILPFGNDTQKNLKKIFWIKKKLRCYPDTPINPNKIVQMAWGKLFKMDIIKKQKLQFPKGLINEDNYWHYLYCAFSKSYTVVHEKLYFYRQDNPDSIMKTMIFQEKHCYDIIKICCRIFDSLQKIDNFEFYRNCLDDFFFTQLENLMSVHHKTAIDKTLWDEVKKYLIRSHTAKEHFNTLVSENKLSLEFLNEKTESEPIKPSAKKKKKKIGLLNSLCRYLVVLLNKLPVKKNRVLFWNMSGCGFGDNPKYIALEMLKRKNFELIWLYNKDKLKHRKEFPKGIKLVEYSSFKALYYLATYNVFIANCRQGLLHKDGLQKKKGQIYIHTWHGSLSFKKFERDYPNLSQAYIKRSIRDSKDIDYISSGSKWAEKVLFGDSFWYSGKYFRGGNPRNDILFNTPPKIKDKVYQYFNLSLNTKIFMYAPTFRDNGDLSVYQMLDYEKLKQTLENKFPGEWVILSRLHPHIITQKNILPEYSWLKDATHYPDMQELLSVSDMVLTDYSSSVFDFLITGRPAFIFAPDKDAYDRERGFHIRLEDSPFPVAYTNEKLIQNIMELNKEKFKIIAKKFLEEKGSYDHGNASKKLVDLILDEGNV